MMKLNKCTEKFSMVKKKKKKMDLSDTFEAQKGDHVLVKGQNRKLPALVGDKVNGDGEFVEVNFYTKTKDKGWKMLEVLHVIKIKEIEGLNDQL